MEAPTTRTDERLAQARAEAERRWFPGHDHEDCIKCGIDVQVREGFELGVVWADANPKPADGDTSDGYHTFDELYEYRMLYNAHAAQGWLAQGIPVVKSWRHADGEECFGGGWFIVTATLPAGQVSNHYESRHWGLFRVPEVDLPPEWDGHTPHDAAMRLRIEAEHANPKPHTITRQQADAAFIKVMLGRFATPDAFADAVRELGIEVVDDA